jgi:hypothetical protein
MSHYLDLNGIYEYEIKAIVLLNVMEQCNVWLFNTDNHFRRIANNDPIVYSIEHLHVVVKTLFKSLIVDT